MAAPHDDSPRRALLSALAAMAGVAVVAGLAVAGVVLGAVKLSGIGDGPATQASSSPSLVVPRPAVTTSPTPTSSPSRTATPAPPPPITLTVSPEQAGAGQRIDLEGAYPGGDGAELRVQRREEGQWVDFPVTTTVADGRYGTWIQTTRPGPSPFRMYDPAGDRSSNVVVITVG